jgi:hypothetical protein
MGQHAIHDFFPPPDMDKIKNANKAALGALRERLAQMGR